MALETNDIFPVQKAGGGSGSVRQATIGALLNLATSTASFWSRTSTTLSPVNAGDDLSDIGDIQAATATFTGAIEADSIDGGFKELSPGEIDYPD